MTAVLWRAGVLAVTRPVEGSTSATLESLVLQVTSWPWGTVTAERVMVCPGARVWLLGETVTPACWASRTVTWQRSVLPPSRVVTVMNAMPALTAVTRPSRTWATCSLSLLQMTVWSAASLGSTEAFREVDSPAFRASSC